MAKLPKPAPAPAAPLSWLAALPPALRAAAERDIAAAAAAAEAPADNSPPAIMLAPLPPVHRSGVDVVQAALMAERRPCKAMFGDESDPRSYRGAIAAAGGLRWAGEGPDRPAGYWYGDAAKVAAAAAALDALGYAIVTMQALGEATARAVACKRDTPARRSRTKPAPVAAPVDPAAAARAADLLAELGGA